MRAGMHGGDRDPEAQVDVVLGIPVLRMDVYSLPFGLAEQVILGQGRTLVGPFVLLADHDQRAVEALPAQRLRCFRAGEARPDDQVRRVHGHGQLPCCRPDRSRRVAASCSPSRSHAASNVVTPLSSSSCVTSP